MQNQVEIRSRLKNTSLIICLLLFVGCSIKQKTDESRPEIHVKDNSYFAQFDSLLEKGSYEALSKKINRKLKDTTLKVDIKWELLNKLYQGISYSGKLDSGQIIFGQLISIAEEQPSPENRSKYKGLTFLSKAKVFQGLELYDSSIVPLKVSRKFLKNFFPEKTAYSYILSAKVSYINYKELEALEYLNSANDILSTGNWGRYILNLHDNWSSIIKQEFGEYELCIQHNRRILNRLSEVKVKDLSREEFTLLIHTYQNLGILYDWKGDISNARNSYTRTLDLIKENRPKDNVEMARLNNNIGISYINRGQFSFALNYFYEALNILPNDSISHEEKKIKIESLLNASFCYQYLENADSALFLAKKAQVLNKPDLRLEDFVFLNLSGSYFGLKNYDQALKYISLSLRKAKDKYGNKSRYSSRALSLKGRILEGMGDRFGALHAFQEAISGLSRVFNYSDLSENPELDLVFDKKDLLFNLNCKIENLILLKDSDNIIGPLNAAWETNSFAREVIQSLRKDYLADLSKFHLLSKAMPIYEMGLQTATLLDSGKNDPKILEEAFKISEQGKGIILQDNLRSAKALQTTNIPKELRAKEDSLRINIAFYGQRVSFFESQDELNAYDSMQYQSAQRNYLQSEEEYANLMRFMEENYDEYKRRKNATEEESLSDIFSYLDSANLSMLEYFWGEKAIYAFRLYEGKIRMYEIEKDSSLLRDIESFRNQVSDASEVYNRGNSPEAFSKYKQTGFRIYQRLLEPLLKEVEAGQDLVIIPDGQLNVFPFEALPYQADSLSQSFRDLNYLIQKHQIHYALSANLLLKNIVHDKNNYGFLGYAPSYEGARKLDFNMQEVNQIADLVNGEARVGSSASKKGFLGEADKWQFLHMAQHAIKAEDPMMSHLLFSKDEKKKDTLSSGVDPQKLFAYEIYNQRIDCELAVLNACETGEGKMAQGEGMLSLSRAFRHAGAESVIMNKWAVNDESSYRILSEFYKYLKAGESTASALRNAKLYYLNNSNKAHPYFWAGSALIGGSSPLTFPEEKFFDLKSQEDLYMFILICCLSMAFFMIVLYQIQRKRRDRATLFKDL